MRLNFALIVGRGESIPPNSLARIFCRLWEGQGHKITLTPCIPIECDIALLHIDATRVNPDVLAGFNPAIPIWNRHALDISKRRVSHNLIERDDAYEGAVVVKTDDNAFGARQFPMTPEHLAILRHRRNVTLETWKNERVLPLDSYPVLDSPHDVPDWVWANRELVVEKFTPEMEDGLYVLRLWIFLGTREVVLKLYGRQPIVKSGDLVRFEYIDEVPDELRAERKRLGIDFGKFDFVVSNGKPILLDANKTPTGGKDGTIPPYARTLSEALFDVFPEGRNP